MELELIGLIENKKKLITNITDMSVDTNVITLKTVHPDSFRKETTKTRIFILQIDNKITNVVRTFEERKIRYVMSLLRKITTK